MQMQMSMKEALLLDKSLEFELIGGWVWNMFTILKMSLLHNMFIYYYFLQAENLSCIQALTISSVNTLHMT